MGFESYIVLKQSSNSDPEVSCVCAWSEADLGFSLGGGGISKKFQKKL